MPSARILLRIVGFPKNPAAWPNSITQCSRSRPVCEILVYPGIGKGWFLGIQVSGIPIFLLAALLSPAPRWPAAR